jgi:hypothetical protein
MIDEMNNDQVMDDAVAPMPEEEATEEEVASDTPAEETGEEAA